MTHIHDLIDFSVVAYIVHDQNVLLVHHKQLGEWLPVGGHVELDEDPEEAILREIQEECGLDVELVGTRPAFSDADVKPLIAPQFLDIHRINDTHRHVGMVYFARGTSDAIVLKEDEHHGIRWFFPKELEDPQYKIRPSVFFYAEEALRALSQRD